MSRDRANWLWSVFLIVGAVRFVQRSPAPQWRADSSTLGQSTELLLLLRCFE